MGIVSCHAGHPVTEQGLTQLIVDTQPLQPGGEGVPEIVKPKVLKPDPSSRFEPILLERTGVGPVAKDPAIRQGREVLSQCA
jgi:hypothetical protein